MANDIPYDTFVDIANRVGRSGFRNLSGIMACNKAGRRAATSHKVLVNVDISEFLAHSGMVKKGTSTHLFYKKCLQKKNPMAMLLEGIRVAFNDLDVIEAEEILQQIPGDCPYKLFALGMVEIMGGNWNGGSQIIEEEMQFRSNPDRAKLVALVIREAVIGMDPYKMCNFRETMHCPQPLCDCFMTKDLLLLCDNCFIAANAILLCMLS